MNELNDRIYRFVMVGRIFFVATFLITAILLTVTAVKAGNAPRTATVEEPDLSLNIAKDDIEVPVTGEEAISEAEQSDTTESEKPASAEAPSEQPADTPASQPVSSEVAPTPQPSYTTPVEQSRPSTPAQQRPTFDYDKVYYTDDNGQPEAAIIPVIANDPSTPVTDDPAEGVAEE